MRSPSAQKFPGGSQELFGTKEGFSRDPTEEPPGDFQRNRSKRIHLRQRSAGKTVHLCCRSPHGERGLKCKGFDRLQEPQWSLPPRGAWIEIEHCDACTIGSMSLPPRGAWIEMAKILRLKWHRQCRSPHGERGLKYAETNAIAFAASRSPHGERGLKSSFSNFPCSSSKSLPPRGAWIEILVSPQ